MAPWHSMMSDTRPFAWRPPLRQTEQTFKPSSIEPDHDLAVDHGHGSRPVPEALELGQRGRVLADVLVNEGDPFLRKKLFLGMAAASAGLTIDDHLFYHFTLLVHASHWFPLARILPQQRHAELEWDPEARAPKVSGDVRMRMSARLTVCLRPRLLPDRWRNVVCTDVPFPWTAPAR